MKKIFFAFLCALFFTGCSSKAVVLSGNWSSTLTTENELGDEASDIELKVRSTQTIEYNFTEKNYSEHLVQNFISMTSSDTLPAEYTEENISLLFNKDFYITGTYKASEKEIFFKAEKIRLSNGEEADFKKFAKKNPFIGKPEHSETLNLSDGLIIGGRKFKAE